MSKFIMLVGLPGCGKSRYAVNKYGNTENTVILSSDEIRKTKNFAQGTGNALVFNIMFDQTLQALKAGKTVIYDATNLSSKRRIGLINQLKHIKGCKFECIFFAESISVCKMRNSFRTGFDLVPDDVYPKMLKSFDIPMYWEGWDNITVIQTASDINLADEYMSLTKGFEQDNKHHTLTLYDHLVKTQDLIKSEVGDSINNNGYYYPAIQAALWHDIGKLLTKDFHNAKGEETTEAHYYGHEKVGAYMYISSRIFPERSIAYDFEDLNIIDYKVAQEFTIASLINWHMRPYLERNMKKSKIDAEHKMLGERFVKNLELLHLADENAH